MKLVRWNPVRDIVSSFSRDLDPFFDDGFFNDRWLNLPLMRGLERHWSPVVDFEEKEDEIVINAELPGMKKSDVELSVENNVLALKGEKKEERREGDKDSDYFRNERFFGKFERCFTLPATVEADKTKATFKDGVLRISLPKKEESKSRKITIS